MVIEDQQYLANDSHLDKVFQVIKSICEYVKDDGKKGQFEKMIENVKRIETSEGRWTKIQELFQGKEHKRTWSMIEKELTLGLLYPKIDAHVSAQTNHLLKCPFNVHHATGKLSLPILDIENFDVSRCPTIFDALEDKSMMEPYYKAFDKFCEQIMKLN